MPASNEVRVRVDGAWKISATERRTSASELYGAALSSAARSSRAPSSSALSSVPVRKWRGTGRRVRRAGRELLDEFGAALESWEWDVALLQEVPPWWTAPLAERLGAEYRQALTSRNALPWLRRELARRWPDAVKSQGGGANAILARRDRIVAHQVQLLTRTPERRGAAG